MDAPTSVPSRIRRYAREPIRVLLDYHHGEALADLLRGWCDESSTRDDAEALIVELARSGRYEEVARHMTKRRGMPLMARLFCVDADVHLFRGDPDALAGLFSQLSSSSSATERMWLAAVSADCHLFRGDLSGITVANVALAEDRQEEPLGALGDLARGRLRRILAIYETLATGASEEHLSGAIADLEAAGCSEEIAITHLLDAGVLAVAGWTDASAQLDSIREQLATLIELGSDRVAFGWLALAGVAASAWDFTTVAAALAAIDRLDISHHGPSVLAHQQVLGLVNELHGPTASLELARRIVDTYESTTPHGLFPGTGAFLAALLLDYGYWSHAKDLLSLESVGGMQLTPTTRLTVTELRARVDLQRHGDRESDLASVRATIEQWIDLGSPRRARELAQRAAWDCHAAGLDQAETEFAAKAQNLRIADGADGAWSVYLTGSGPERAARPPKGRIVLFGPDVVVTRPDGQPVHLPNTLARFLIYLTVARRPVETDWLVETLWPGVIATKGRSRLKAHLWRLREALGPDASLIERAETGLAVNAGEGDWSIDLWDFQDKILGTSSEKLDAFRIFRGDICFRQFPYDDHIETVRRVTRKQWATLAQALLGTNTITVTVAAQHLLALTSADLAPEATTALTDILFNPDRADAASVLFDQLREF